MSRDTDPTQIARDPDRRYGHGPAAQDMIAVTVTVMDPDRRHGRR